jgi:hypothetical protein
MSGYDDAVFAAKQNVTKLVCDVASDDQRRHRFGVEQLPGAIDHLNKAWDELTNCLVRQRTERDEQISRLISELAEAKK